MPHLAVLIPALLVLAVWVARYAVVRAVERTQPTLRGDEPAELPADPPRVTIIVPAKDEEANIGPCIETLLAQDYPDFEVIVVDDRSTDGTAEVVRRMAADDARVRLVQVVELAPGWFGKSHAMYFASQHATGEWLWFVDADCRQTPRSLRVAMAYALAGGGDMLSLWPLLEMKGFAENLIQPLCGSILGLRFRPQLVNDPRRKAAFANGQFVLVRRSTYEAVDGHRSVRADLLEDIAFARVVKGRGHRLLNAMGFGLFSTRMYAGLRATWRGWARIFSGAFIRPGFLLLLVLVVTAFSASPFVLAATSWPLAVRAAWADPWLNALAAVAAAQLAAMAVVLSRYNRMMGARPVYLLLYPLSVLVVLGILINAFVIAIGWKRIRWRGTTYPPGTRLDDTGSAE